MGGKSGKIAARSGNVDGKNGTVGGGCGHIHTAIRETAIGGG